MVLVTTLPDKQDSTPEVALLEVQFLRLDSYHLLAATETCHSLL